MRSLFLPSMVAMLLVVLVRFAGDPANPSATFGVLIALLCSLATLDWLVTRHLEIISPVRVYLLLGIGAMGLGWLIYLFSYLGPVVALSLAGGLGRRRIDADPPASHTPRPRSRRAVRRVRLRPVREHRAVPGVQRPPGGVGPAPPADRRRNSRDARPVPE